MVLPEVGLARRVVFQLHDEVVAVMAEQDGGTEPVALVLVIVVAEKVLDLLEADVVLFLVGLAHVEEIAAHVAGGLHLGNGKATVVVLANHLGHRVEASAILVLLGDKCVLDDEIDAEQVERGLRETDILVGDTALGRVAQGVEHRVEQLGPAFGEFNLVVGAHALLEVGQLFLEILPHPLVGVDVEAFQHRLHVENHVVAVGHLHPLLGFLGLCADIAGFPVAYLHEGGRAPVDPNLADYTRGAEQEHGEHKHVEGADDISVHRGILGGSRVHAKLRFQEFQQLV